MILDKNDIQKILPHRQSMLLLDTVEEKEGVSHGTLNITGEEYFLNGHFPGNPVVPGVILCEVLAQSACVLLADKKKENNTLSTYFCGLDKVKFKNKVVPPVTFRTECKITKVCEPFYFAYGEGYVGDTLCVSANFSFAVYVNKTTYDVTNTDDKQNTQKTNKDTNI